MRTSPSDQALARRGWAVAALLLLTVATGLIDAVSYLKLGHVFVANMTGNVVFLGFGLNSESGFMVIAPIIATLGFLCGAALGGGIAALFRSRQRWWLCSTFAAQAGALAAVSLLVGVGTLPAVGRDAHVLVAVLAASFGLQSATVRQLAPRELNTTVLTMTLTGLASDAALGRLWNVQQHRRLASIGAMLAGAATGALLLEATTVGVIVVAAGLAAVAAAIFGVVPANSGTFDDTPRAESAAASR